jgi:hypothetical protein
MKNIICLLFAITFVSSLCFAQQTTAPVSQSAPKPEERKTFTGKVDFVSIVGSPTNEIPSKIVIADDKGQKLTVVVIGTATVSDKDGKIIRFEKIVKGNKVVVEYTTTQAGINEMKSIKMVE